MLSVVSYERKNIIFYEKNLKLLNNNTFNNVFCNIIFSYYRFLPNSKKLLDLLEPWLLFSRKIFSTTTANLKTNLQWLKSLKKFLKKKHFFK